MALKSPRAGAGTHWQLAFFVTAASVATTCVLPEATQISGDGSDAAKGGSGGGSIGGAAGGTVTGGAGGVVTGGGAGGTGGTGASAGGGTGGAGGGGTGASAGGGTGGAGGVVGGGGTDASMGGASGSSGGGTDASAGGGAAGGGGMGAVGGVGMGGAVGGGGTGGAIGGGGAGGTALGGGGSGGIDAGTGGVTSLAFATGSFPAGAAQKVQSVATADFNGDGKVDVAVSIETGGASVLLGNGDGTFKAKTDYLWSDLPNPQTYWITTGDWDGNGKSDLVVSNRGANKFSTALGTGTGTFGAWTHVATSVLANSFFIARGDLNTDLHDDLLLVDVSYNRVISHLGNGDGTFQGPAEATVQTNPYGAAIGDWNGDGKPDVAVANAGSKNVTVLLGEGNGTFKPFPNSFAVGDGPRAVVAGYFNSDSFLDIAVASNFLTTSAHVTVLMGKGDGTFLTSNGYLVTAAPIDIRTADFDGDGHADLALALSSVNKVDVLLGNGDGTFQQVGSHSYSVGAFPNALAVADFNGDGKPDLVTANYLAGTVTVLLNTTSGP